MAGHLIQWLRTFHHSRKYLPYLQNTSKETVATTLIHEVGHAYFGTLGESQTHQDLATKFVEPMDEFLVDAYGLSRKDAISLAWSGLPDSQAYIDQDEFVYDYDQNNQPLKVGKSIAGNISASYATNSEAVDGIKRGTPICDP